MVRDKDYNEWLVKAEIIRWRTLDRKLTINYVDDIMHDRKQVKNDLRNIRKMVRR